jgi:hypothetical protein
MERTKDCEDLGLVGFEPTASASRTQRSTKLSHSPYSNRCPTYHIDVQNAKASEPEIGN